MEPLILRDQLMPPEFVVVRLGSMTLEPPRLPRSIEECHDRWGIWGFSVLEVPDGDYEVLARLRPAVVTRRLLFESSGPDLVAAGFPLLPTLAHPHWTVVVSEPSAEQLHRVRGLFTGPIQNPVWFSGS